MLKISPKANKMLEKCYVLSSLLSSSSSEQDQNIIRVPGSCEVQISLACHAKGQPSPSATLPTGTGDKMRLNFQWDAG